MDYIYCNIEIHDCTVVAIYNAIVASGMKAEYWDVRELCIKNGWYDPNRGFYTALIPTALKFFKLKSRKINQIETKKLSQKVKNGKNLLFVCKTEYATGHSFVAIKGTKGVVIVNPFQTGTGWKTMCKDLKGDNFKIELALEIKSAA